MNKKQIDALLNLVDAFSEAVQEANPGHIIPVRLAVRALRIAFAEPEPGKTPAFTDENSVYCSKCGGTGMGKKLLDCPVCSGHGKVFKSFAKPEPLPTPEDVRGILAEPEPPKAEEPVPCVECGEEPKIDLGVEGFYINCKGCCNTPDCLTRKGAIRVWNAMQEAARRER